MLQPAFTNNEINSKKINKPICHFSCCWGCTIRITLTCNGNHLDRTSGHIRAIKIYLLFDTFIPVNVREGTLNCKLHWYPKFFNHVIVIDSNSFEFLSLNFGILIQTSSVQIFQPIILIYGMVILFIKLGKYINLSFIDISK